MGDMADMAMEQGLSMAWEDGIGYYDEGFIGGIGNSVKYCTCKYCHTYLLRWTQTDKGWRMIDQQGEIHSCKEYHTSKRKTLHNGENGNEG